MTQPLIPLEKVLEDAIARVRQEREAAPPERPLLQYDVVQFAYASIKGSNVGDHEVEILLYRPPFWSGYLVGFALRVLSGGRDLHLNHLFAASSDATAFNKPVECTVLEELQPKGIDLPSPVRIQRGDYIRARFSCIREGAELLFVLRFWTDQQRQLPVEER